MNPFSNLIDPAGGLHAHKELAGALKRSREAPMPDDEASEGDRPSDTGALEFEVVSRRIYRPKGLTLAALRLLQDGSPWTAAELSRGIGRDGKEVDSLLATAVRHGIVRKLNTSPILWELT